MKELIQNVFDKATKYIKEMRVGYASNRKSLSFCTSSPTSSTIKEEIKTNISKNLPVPKPRPEKKDQTKPKKSNPKVPTSSMFNPIGKYFQIIGASLVQEFQLVVQFKYGILIKYGLLNSFKFNSNS